MRKRFLCMGAAMLLAVAVFAAKSEATTITFDGGISGALAPDNPGDPYDDCVVYCGYLPTAGNEGVFTTQGFRFAALPNMSGTGDQGLGVVVNANLLSGVPDNTTDWLLAGGIVQMTRADSTAFSLFSFQAAHIDPSDPLAGDFIRAFAFKAGVAFQLLTFDLNASTAFQTFTLPSTWTDLSSVNFSGRLSAADGFPRITAIDNIEVAAVPEPASLLLFGTGLVALALRRFKTRT